MQIWDYRNFKARMAPPSAPAAPSTTSTTRGEWPSSCISPSTWSISKRTSPGVIDAFCADYFAGRTPNPCVLCNQVLKFELLLRRAMELEADFLATGHYARIARAGHIMLAQGARCRQGPELLPLHPDQGQLAKVRFPLGDFTKDEVRAHAARLQLRVAEKAESQDLCFVPDGDYVRFLEEQRRRRHHGR